MGGEKEGWREGGRPEGGGGEEENRGREGAWKRRRIEMEGVVVGGEEREKGQEGGRWR